MPRKFEIEEFLFDSEDYIWLEYGADYGNRILYLGSHDSDDEDTEAGVNWQMARYFISALVRMDLAERMDITIHMNTPGGEWSHGMAIYDAIKACRSHVTIIGYGCVRSMSSVIFQAADDRALTPHCDFMIHDGHDVLEGIPRSTEAWAKHGERVIRPTMYRIYSRRAAVEGKVLPVATVAEWCRQDTIFTATKAVRLGFADRIERTRR